MRSVRVTISLVIVATHAHEQGKRSSLALHDAGADLHPAVRADLLVDSLLERALQVDWLARDDVDDATLGKGSAALQRCGYRGCGLCSSAGASSGRRLSSKKPFRVTTSSGDSTVKFWSVDGTTAKQDKTLNLNEGGVYSVSFSRDGARIATAGFRNETARIWSSDVESKDPLLTTLKDSAWVANAFWGRHSTTAPPLGRWTRSWESMSPWTGENISFGMEALIEHLKETRVTAWVHAAEFTPDGNKLIMSCNRRIYVWAKGKSRGKLEMKKMASLKLHNDVVYSIAISPDGKRMASGANDRRAMVWDISDENPAKWRELRTFRGHIKCVHGVAFSPDGSMLITGSWDKSVKIWSIADENVTNWREITTLHGHRSAVYSVQFSPDGNKVATGSWDMTAKIWDVSSNDPSAWGVLKTLKGHTDAIYRVAWSPDGSMLGTASKDKTAKIWCVEGEDSDKWRELHTLTGHSKNVYGIAFAPDASIATPASKRAIAIADSPIVVGEAIGAPLVPIWPEGQTPEMYLAEQYASSMTLQEFMGDENGTAAARLPENVYDWSGVDDGRAQKKAEEGTQTRIRYSTRRSSEATQTKGSDAAGEEFDYPDEDEIAAELGDVSISDKTLAPSTSRALATTRAPGTTRAPATTKAPPPTTTRAPTTIAPTTMAPTTKAPAAAPAVIEPDLAQTSSSAIGFPLAALIGMVWGADVVMAVVLTHRCYRRRRASSSIAHGESRGYALLSN